MQTDTERLDWLTKQIEASGYSIEMVKGAKPPVERMVIKIMVGSGPWQREYKAFDIRQAIDMAMDDSKN